MKTEDKDLIEKKLREKLSKEEQDKFSSKLESDEEFREEYALEKQLFENLNDTDWSLTENTNDPEIEEYAKLFKSRETVALAEKLAAITEERRNQNKGKPVNRNMFWFGGLAATFLILMVSVFIFYFSPDSPQELYTAYLDITEVPSLIPRGEAKDEILVEAQELFETGNFKEAIPVFDQALSGNKSNLATILIYKGIAQMESDQLEAATATFDQLIESKLLDATKGYWYKALVFLKKGEEQRAIDLLEKIKSESLYNSAKAEELLEKL